MGGPLKGDRERQAPRCRGGEKARTTEEVYFASDRMAFLCCWTHPVCTHPPHPPQAKSYGDAELLDRLEGKARIVALQQRLADALAAAGGAIDSRCSRVLEVALQQRLADVLVAAGGL